MDSPWLTVPEVAQHARCGHTEVKAALADESLHGHQLRPGAKWKVQRHNVDAWLCGAPPTCICLAERRTA